MKAFKIIFILILMQSLHMTAQDIMDFRWKNRLVILYENQNNQDAVQTALQIINDYTVELKERDILVFVYKDGELIDSHKKPVLFKSSGVLPDSSDGYILIGKDGGIKSKTSYPFDLERLFNLIDGMPMRKSEMRSNN